MGRVSRTPPAGSLPGRRYRALAPIRAAMENRGRIQKVWLAEHANVSAQRMVFYLSGRSPWPEAVFNRVCFLLEVPREQVLRLETPEVLFQAQHWVTRTERMQAKRRNAA